MGRYEDFKAFRERLNDRVLNPGEGKPKPTLVTKRFFGLDGKAYEPGAIDEKHKELLGLSASMVLRCDDCIAYHAERCAALGFTKEEIVDALSVSYVVGGSITIPHLRRVLPIIDEAIAERDGA